MTAEYTINSFRNMIGRNLGVSDWVTIGQSEIDRFAAATGDTQWIHTDPEHAKSGPFHGTIAHGLRTMSLLPRLLSGIYRVTDAALVINYGFNRVRFPSPVLSGSQIRAHADLLSFDEDGTSWRSTVRASVELRGQEKPACVAENVVLVVPQRVRD